MRNYINEGNGIKYFQYNKDKSVIEDKDNLIIYTYLEQYNLKLYDITFPFYYSRDERFFFINKDKPILEQIYDYLNSLHKYYSTSKYIIVKLIRDYDNICIKLVIHPIISKNSPLGDELRIKCNSFPDYLNICLNERMEIDNNRFHNFVLKKHSHLDQNLMGFLHYFNCGIFQYNSDGKVNRFELWEPEIWYRDIFEGIDLDENNSDDEQWDEDDFTFEDDEEEKDF